jgi:hypothetical protein
MSILQFFQSLLGKNLTTPHLDTFECPNCWGIQQWEDQQLEPLFDDRRDPTSISKARKGFTQPFADRYVPGIRKPHRT